MDNLNEEVNRKSEIIVICSAKGGVGRTVITTNLAVALCKNNMSVCVVDGDFQFGDICLAMDLKPTFTIKDVAEEISRSNSFTLSSFLNSHESGVKVLAAPERPEYSDLITNDVIDETFNLLRPSWDFILVDTGVGLQEKSLQLIEKADRILLITNLEMATLKNTRLMQHTLDILGMKDKVQIVVNRATMDSVIQAADIPEILGASQPIYIPNDFQVSAQSLNIGIPFVSSHGKTELAKALFKMAEQISTSKSTTTVHPKNKSVISRLFNKSKNLKTIL